MKANTSKHDADGELKNGVFKEHNKTTKRSVNGACMTPGAN